MQKLKSFFLLVCGAMLLCIATGAQPSKKAKIRKGDIYDYTEKMPAFPGGLEALKNYLVSRIVYPEIAREQNTEGSVIIGFVVDKKGRVTDVHVVKGVSPALDAEALRVVRIMPSWKPGSHRGRLVKVYFTLPVTFRLVD